MGLILSQSVVVGVAVGIYDSKLWLVLDNALLNGMTYAMAAFAMQGLGYYVFKMFFQQGMDDRVRMQEGERRRHSRYRDMQHMFDQRREDLELRMQESQLDNELRWMEANPGQMPPVGGVVPNGPYSSPEHSADIKAPLELGAKKDEGKRNPDGTFKSEKG